MLSACRRRRASYCSCSGCDEPSRDVCWAGHTPDQPRIVVDVTGLGSGRSCDVWWERVEDHAGATAVLLPDEAAAAARFQLDHDRATYIASRVAQRRIMQKYLPLEPLRIVHYCPYCAQAGSASSHGRPTIDGSLDYSVSHSRDWIAIAVLDSARVGVDVEAVDASNDLTAVATSMFTPHEMISCGQVADRSHASCLLNLWTRKEAASKVTAVGLRAPFERLDATDDRIEMPTPNDEYPPVVVHLRKLDAPAGHVASLAATKPLDVIRLRSTRE